MSDVTCREKGIPKMALALWLFSPRAIAIGWGPSHRHPYLATIIQHKIKKNYTTLDEKKTGRSLGWLWCFWTRLAFPNWIFKEWVSICISEAQTYALSVSTSGLTGLENSLESFFSSWIFCSIKGQSSIYFPLKIIFFWMFTHVLMFNVVIDHTAHVISRMGFVGFSNDLLEGWRA